MTSFEQVVEDQFADADSDATAVAPEIHQLNMQPRQGHITQMDEDLYQLKAAFGFDKNYSNVDDEVFDENDQDAYAEFDELETELLGEDYSLNSQGHGQVGDYSARVNLSKSAQNDIVRSEKTLEKKKTHTGRDDRATVEQVLDPRTRLILFKFLSTGFLECVDGCLSTGKEANVYYARGSDGREYAVKIYKTSILVFKDRDKYVSGDYRLRRGYCKSNPRKMVRTWAEKELRNLKRLQSAGIPSPQPVLLKSHVLLMDFLGKDAWPSPRMKDAELTPEQYARAYEEACLHMRTMYTVCKLVHGDLSEYNMLWHEDKVFFIDVSQSVEHEHPYATEFLRKDCHNVMDFFSRNGVPCLSTVQLFRFVTDKTIAAGEAAMKQSLQELLLQREEDDEISEETKMEDAVFLRSYIPRTLMELSNPHAEHALIAGGGREKSYATAVERMLAGDNMDEDNEADVVISRAKPTARPGAVSSVGVRFAVEEPTSEEQKSGSDVNNEDDDEGSDDGDDDDDDDEEEEDDDDDDDDEEEEEGVGEGRRRFPKEPVDPEAKAREKEARKAAKKQTKLDQAEKRKGKMKKHLKKQKIKRTAHRK